MNRNEALRILGLDDEASIEDVKIAYKETVQILHPDRFASNKKLQNRATEQFKNLQEAYEFLMKNAGRASGKKEGPTSRSGSHSRSDMLEARLAGISAARVQLVAQRDSFSDSRRNGLLMAVGGAIVGFLLRRIPAIAAIASACAVWGIVDAISATNNIKSLDERLSELNKEKMKISAELEDLD